MKTLYLVHHPPDRQLTKAMEQAGHYAHCARDASAALGALKAVRADLFVIDVGDRHVGGERLFEQLRGEPEWRDIPVILTGARAEQFERLAQRVGAGVVLRSGEDHAKEVAAQARRLLPPRGEPRANAPFATCSAGCRKAPDRSSSAAPRRSAVKLRSKISYDSPSEASCESLSKDTGG